MKTSLTVFAVLVMIGAELGAERAETKRSTATPDANAYQQAIGFLKKGEQQSAEAAIAEAVRDDPDNQRLVFFLGVCRRSRWVKRDAWPIFDYVVKLDPETPEGLCSALMLAIDRQKDYEKSFEALEVLHKKHPEDPLILWLAAIACRELGLRKAPRHYSEQGALYYGKLLEIFDDPGPVLLHQTYANILSEQLDRHQDALKHREIALRLEPKSWSHQGMANTLTRLERYDEADVHYRKCVELAPDDPGYLANWAWSMERRAHPEKAFDLYEKAAAIAPDHPQSWFNLGRCAARLKRHEDAARYFNQAREIAEKHNRE